MVVVHPERPQETIMAWKKPRIVEVSLALEINSYACAEIG
jgi:coenzyme PQQ precursor peptide PqqA